jgi:hypothetical protein
VITVVHRQWLGVLAAYAASIFGRRLRDHRTGEVLGNGILWAWGGRIHLFGYRGAPLVCEFQPVARVSYWRQVLVFRRQDEPDFPSLLT